MEAKREPASCRENIERYCHVIGANVLVNRFTRDGKTMYECLECGACEKNGGCRNERYRPPATNDAQAT